MLYKKYHRSYVSQFKKGVKFRYNDTMCEVTRGPYITQNDILSPQVICIEDKLYTWTLLFPGGRTYKDLLYVV